MNKVLVDQSLLEDILENRHAIFGLSCSHSRKLRKLLKQSLPSLEGYEEIYKNKPFWTYSGSYGLGAGTWVNQATSIQKLLVDKSFIQEMLSQEYHIFGLKQSTVIQLSLILEKGIVPPYEYAQYYNEQQI